MSPAGTPVLFVHGLWLHALSWEPWMDRFRQAGYEPSAPRWPGEALTVEDARQTPEAVAGHGIDDVVDHHVTAVRGLSAKPVVVGHSFGGLVAQRLLTEGHASAAAALDPAPIKGVMWLPLSALRVASIALRNPANRKRAVSLTPGQFRYGFGNAVSAEESQQLYDRWAIPSPGKPLFEASVGNFKPGSPAKVDTKRGDRGPLLLTAGGRDHTVPATISKQTQRLYRKSPAVTELKEFPDRGHSLGIDSGWEEVADYVLEWLERQKL
jgi:alpha-beta hydrolase superfamily lysophospholipase